ncbi:MAG: CBS domain-containing protein [Anaerolineales bacterium]|nr:CBS domain-containing protein [Anaerolineales bacterium]NUQ83792.1 CBS domain-containing protein [Anaerolineales bacterium]
MPNTVRDWMSSPVVVVDPDSSVKYALTLMRRRKIHSVVVDISEKNPAYGIVTTTDIRDKIVAEGRNPAETTVREIMSGPIVTGKPGWTLMECSKVMQEHRIHHLPIADESGALIGLISATDIFMAVEEIGWQGDLNS